jgi:hypothetical protein
MAANRSGRWAGGTKRGELGTAMTPIASTPRAAMAVAWAGSLSPQIFSSGEETRIWSAGLPF